jgi:protein-S-isoprenylcysteine O-methyltransferase Ste14
MSAAVVAAFLAGSAGLVYVSRGALRATRSHGFYRFFAWECLLALFLLNVGRWFRDPLSPAQLVSWPLLLISAFLALHAASQLRSSGRPGRTRTDASLIGIEKTTALVTEGVYRYIRHPLYSSLLFLGWGIFFKGITWPAAALAVAATILLAATARADEAECLEYFGAAYREYMQRTKMFIPFVI